MFQLGLNLGLVPIYFAVNEIWFVHGGEKIIGTGKYKRTNREHKKGIKKYLISSTAIKNEIESKVRTLIHFFHQQNYIYSHSYSEKHVVF